MAMTLSTRGRYATRIMVCLAESPGRTKPMTRTEIAANEDISANYVEQLMAPLRAAGLVRSHRGRHGGFSLARAAEKVTVADVLRAVEGPLVLVPCVGPASCDRAPDCPTRPVWQRASAALERVFTATTIADMIRDNRLPNSPSYSI